MRYLITIAAAAAIAIVLASAIGRMLEGIGGAL